MTKHINNEPAYPFKETYNTGFIYNHFGLTKREAFAMAAMQGLVANGERYMNYVDEYEKRATQAVKYADALLEALNNDT